MGLLLQKLFHPIAPSMIMTTPSKFDGKSNKNSVSIIVLDMGQPLWLSNSSKTDYLISIFISSCPKSNLILNYSKNPSKWVISTTKIVEKRAPFVKPCQTIFFFSKRTYVQFMYATQRAATANSACRLKALKGLLGIQATSIVCEAGMKISTAAADF